MTKENIAGVGLKEPEQVDWDKVGSGSTYVAPPPAKGPTGNYLVYTGQLPPVASITLDVHPENGFRTYQFDPIKLVKTGVPGLDGYQIRFASVGLKPFKNGSNSTAVLIKGAGLAAKPQKTAEYDAVVKQLAGKVVPFTIEWQAKNKDTGEIVRGYDNFPDDPERPGQKKSILKAGDTYKDENGETQTVQSEVLFANARLRFFESKKA